MNLIHAGYTLVLGEAFLTLLATAIEFAEILIDMGEQVANTRSVSVVSPSPQQYSLLVRCICICRYVCQQSRGTTVVQEVLSNSNLASVISI